MDLVTSDYITILCSLLTGCFILFLIENNHIEEEVNKRYYAYMIPLYRQMTIYVKIIGKACFLLKFEKADMDNHTYQTFLNLVNVMKKWNYRCIMSGYDIPVLKGKELHRLCLDINNIWFYYDRYEEVRSAISNRSTNNPNDYDEIKLMLSQLSPKYENYEIDETLLAKLSGDFYVDVCQKREDDGLNYDNWITRTRVSTNIMLICIVLCMIPLLLLLLQISLASSLVSSFTMVCMLLMLYTIYGVLELKKYGEKLFR